MMLAKGHALIPVQYKARYRSVDRSSFCARPNSEGSKLYRNRFVSEYETKVMLNTQTYTRYWNKHYFEATSAVRAIADAHELSMAEVALRWLCHHSVLKRDFGDSVLIGASSLKHVKQVRYLLQRRFPNLQRVSFRIL